MQQQHSTPSKAGRSQMLGGASEPAASPALVRLNRSSHRWRQRPPASPGTSGSPGTVRVSVPAVHRLPRTVVPLRCRTGLPGQPHSIRGPVQRRAPRSSACRPPGSDSASSAGPRRSPRPVRVHTACRRPGSGRCQRLAVLQGLNRRRGSQAAGASRPGAAAADGRSPTGAERTLPVHRWCDGMASTPTRRSNDHPRRVP